MPVMATRRIGNVIASTAGPLGLVRDKCARIARLDERMREIVPAPLLDHVHLVLADAERVVLEAESSAWLTRLRFHLPQLERLLRRELGVRARKIEIRVAAREGRASMPTGPRIMLSKRTAGLLEETARSIDDPGLSAALQRLARRSR